MLLIIYDDIILTYKSSKLVFMVVPELLFRREFHFTGAKWCLRKVLNPFVHHLACLLVYSVSI